jgi:3',5'-cyclic AMP phosphodiesterase CpdA
MKLMLKEYIHKCKNMLHMKLGKNKIISASFAVFLVASGVFFGYLYRHRPQPLSIIGVVTDIHAANDKQRLVEGNVYGFPRKFKTYFPYALEEMKKQGVSVVLALGDNTNVGKSHYAKDLVEMAKSAKMDVIWVKGNHDTRSSGVMKYFGVDQTYYLRDFQNWRIIVLDSTAIDPNGIGGIDAVQMEWLKQTLKTDKSVIIAMHHPIWQRANEEAISPIYGDFEKIISGSGNVKMVFSGHWHTEDWTRTYDGIEYHEIPSLTADENNAQFKIIKL